MNDDDFQSRFDQARDALKRESAVDEESLRGFEHGVWSEIALRDEKAGLRWWRLLARAPLASAAVAAVSIASGIILGLTQASAYGRETAREFEQRYLESIHPVMMSNSTHPHPHFDGEAPHEHPPAE